jgi:predicted Zn finger-like uncharacterized protein
MRFDCPACQANYQIEDERVENQPLKLKCRKCETVLLVSRLGARRALTVSAGDPVSMAPGMSVPPEVATASPSQASVVLAPPSFARRVSRIPEVGWWAGVDGVSLGPLNTEELEQRFRAGTIRRDTLIWRTGLAGWVALEKVSEFQSWFQPEAPAAPEPESSGAGDRPSPSPQSDSGLLTMSSDSDSEFESLMGSDGAATPLPVSVPPAAHRDSIWATAMRGPRTSQIAFAVASAAVFGLALGFLIFGGKPPQIVERLVEVKVKEAVEAAEDVPPPVEVSAAAAPAPVIPEAPAHSRAPRPAGSVAPVVRAEEAAAPTSGGLAGLAGLSGGTAPSGPVGGVKSGGSSLDPSQVEGAVARYRSSVKRGCWQPALDTKSADAPKTARVSLHVTIAATGKVTQLTSSGDPSGYPGLAKCIEGRVQSWQFPVSGGSTKVNLPFVFAAQ